MKKQKKPVILAGVGAKHAKTELIQLSEKFEIPMIVTLPAKGMVPDGHPNFLGNLGKIGTKPAYEAMQETDLLILLGTDYPYVDYLPSKKVPCIQVDIEQEKMSHRYPADVEIVADMKDCLTEWNKADVVVKNRSFLKACQDNMKNWQSWMEEDEAKADVPLAPEALWQKFETLVSLMPFIQLMWGLQRFGVHAIFILEMRTNLLRPLGLEQWVVLFPVPLRPKKPILKNRLLPLQETAVSLWSCKILLLRYIIKCP